MLSSLARFARNVHVWRRPAEPRFDPETAAALAEIAHEMRQPLTAALAAFHVLQRDAAGMVPQRAWAVLDRQFERLTRLLDDLSEATRSGLHVKRLRMEQLDLRDVVEQAVEAIRPSLSGKRQRLDLELPPAPVWVDADWGRLQQVLSNLLLNGIKYTPPDGVLRVKLTEGGGRAVLHVSDTGRGIHATLLSKVFDPFVTGDDASGRGLGVGLAIAREFVERHGGTIHATSPGAGRGSDFVVTLPGRPPGGRHDVSAAGDNGVDSARA